MPTLTFFMYELYHITLKRIYEKKFKTRINPAQMTISAQRFQRWDQPYCVGLKVHGYVDDLEDTNQSGESL
ncbi:4657_t:CDS:2 [Funneliformis geosporum]|uniref:4657_t:CDS:1 n=1 Tax=Funneliformis geosporum TaxID=1117311 RepID=A0A9W4SFD5_9GLOM|nr:4657_t:CDS:2 [Funneliformis geosporum]